LRSIFPPPKPPPLFNFSTSVFDTCRGFTVEEDEARRLMPEGQVDSFGVDFMALWREELSTELGKDRTRRNTEAAAITARTNAISRDFYSQIIPPGH
jgi:hypothetical protein